MNQRRVARYGMDVNHTSIRTHLNINELQCF